MDGNHPSRSDHKPDHRRAEECMIDLGHFLEGCVHSVGRTACEQYWAPIPSRNTDRSQIRRHTGQTVTRERDGWVVNDHAGPSNSGTYVSWQAAIFMVEVELRFAVVPK
jgi:hypothetical protein